MAVGRPSLFVLALLLSAGAFRTTAQSKPSNSSNPTQTNTQPNNSQRLGCGGITNPGDGSGITVAMADAMNAAAAQRPCVSNTNPANTPNTRLYAPRTAAGSAYMNALQGFLSALAVRSAPAAQPGSSETPAEGAPINVPFSPLIDPSSFAQAGKDSISRGMDNLLADCPEAVQYVESPDGLLGEFDKVFAQYKIKKDGLESIRKVKGDLLDDTWWARSSGPDVAREVKGVADLLGDVFGMVSPEGEVVKSIQQIENVSPMDQAGYGRLGDFRESVDNIKGAYEHNENVDDATKKAAIELTKKFLKNTKYGRVVPFVDFAQHLEERALTQEDGYKLKVEVEYQVRRLDSQISEYQNQIDDDVQAINAMNAVHDTVIGVCVQKSISIGNGPQQ
jgi:hypothetical protein